jgi:hypothetical protein
MNHETPTADLEKLWVVSPARVARFAIDFPGMEKGPVTAREYRISAIGHYLVSPAALNIRRRLAGCEIHWQVSRISRWLSPFRRFVGKNSADRRAPLSLLMDFPNPVTSPFASDLKRHIERLYDGLRPFDTFFRTLEGIEPDQVSRIVGICEDEDGLRAPVALAGAPLEQLDFVRRQAGRQIDVRLKRAHIADGLFEMKGFDFTHFDPRTAHRLIRFVHEGQPKACVLNEDHTIAFWLDDVKLVNYLQLFEFCIQHNRPLRESLLHCIHGKSAAQRLLFNPHLAIDYSRAPLPAVFQEAIGRIHPPAAYDGLIKQNLNQYQVGVSFNTMNLQEGGRSELCTHISVLQDLRALEPIKDHVPELFAEMAKRSAPSEEGSYYLLESISGARHGG